MLAMFPAPRIRYGAGDFYPILSTAVTRLYSDHAYDRTGPVGSYWETTVDPARRAHAPLCGDATADVAVIGAGFTGLNAALRLVEAHDASVAVLDAGDVGWGASGRNGGFCCRGGTKRSESYQLDRFGLDETKRFRAFQRDAIDQVRALLADNGIDADTHSNGELCLAHRPRDVAALEAEAAFLRDAFGETQQLHSREDLAAMGVAGPEFFGGMTLADGFALNPMKYVTGLAEVATKAGAAIHGRSPVSRVERSAGLWRLATPEGTLSAKRLIVATNGYTQDDLMPPLGGRLLPALSSIIVTRPLTGDEQRAQGWTCDLMSYDTRHLLHYFRLMPDGRFLFGMRGGTNTDPASDAVVRKTITADFHRMFPAWATVEIDHFWSGLVCLAYDRSAYLGAVPDAEDAFAALAFHGNGVSTGSYSGRIVADLAVGAITPADIPAILRGPLKRFPLPPMRKTWLKAAYRWYGLMDEVF